MIQDETMSKKKNVYNKPKLKEHGNIEDITRGGGDQYPDADEPASTFG